MKILYVGAVVPEEYSLEIKENSLAGNKLQMNLINELRKNVDVDILSFICVPLTEQQQRKIDNYNKKNKYDKYYYKGSNTFLNIKKFRKEIKEKSKNYDLVMTFNVNYPWLRLPRISKCEKNLLILSDFSDTNSFSNPLLKIYAKICKRDFLDYTHVVGLSKLHKNYLNKNQKFMYMPGGVKISDFKKTSATPINGEIKVMYSGFLGKVTGIDMLVNVFKKGNIKNAKLIITGRGELEDFIKQNCSESINYLGSLSEKDYLETLSNSNILINPRNMNLPENQNNFPSKVFDYLAVGKVLVSTKFSGYEDFLDNFYFCESNEEDMEKTLKKAINEYNKNYKDFMKKNTAKVKEYSWDKQIKKIIEFINS